MALRGLSIGQLTLPYGENTVASGNKWRKATSRQRLCLMDGDKLALGLQGCRGMRVEAERPCAKDRKDRRA